MFGICNLAIVPVRAEASDRSEMISQLLFGGFFYYSRKIAKMGKNQSSIRQL